MEANQECLRMVSLSENWDRLERLSKWGKNQTRPIQNFPAYSLEEAKKHFEQSSIDFYIVDGVHLSMGEARSAIDPSFLASQKAAPFTGFLFNPKVKSVFANEEAWVDLLLFDGHGLEDQLALFNLHGLRRLNANTRKEMLHFAIDGICDQLTILFGMSSTMVIDSTKNSPEVKEFAASVQSRLKILNNQLSEIKSLAIGRESTI